MANHTHRFVDTYDGFIGFGFNREVNENTLKVYLQKFSDDDLLQTLIPRLTDKDMETLFDALCRLLKTHLSEQEYHRLFLKE